MPETESTGETDTGELTAACGVHLIKTAGTEIQIYAETFFFFFSSGTWCELMRSP